MSEISDLAERQPCRPVYVLRLRPEPGSDHVRAMRALLKLLLRVFRMRCIAITTEDR
jgi:hypothetical protein